MYIIELIFKLKEKFKDLRQRRLQGGLKGLQDATFSVQSEENLEEEYEKCEHIFGPVDSTNTVLACVKCGFLIHCKENEFKKKNIFEDDLT